MNNWQGSVCSVVFIGNDIQEKALKDRQTKESEIRKKNMFFSFHFQKSLKRLVQLKHHRTNVELECFSFQGFLSFKTFSF